MASIFDPSTTPPVLQPIGVQTGGVGAWLRFAARATATQNDPVTLTISNAPAGSALIATNTAGTFSWMPEAVGIWTVRVYAADNDGADFEAVPMTILVDQDGDGLPSWWEQLYFDGGTNAAPSEDSDLDHMSNLQEWIAGSNPRDSNSFLAADMAWQGGALRLSSRRRKHGPGVHVGAGGRAGGRRAVGSASCHQSTRERRNSVRPGPDAHRPELSHSGTNSLNPFRR